ncbi:uncharacterized protein LOC107476304 [Arachis duranensis]|uniref:Uncharacterized protein LOC107476304 n=1 Tax=Arachis duranensis TaxID=130453 RepID=A0A6P4CIN1_ARADU|nr:uncharacterized protein LOC107476304 [Arachis duranensis]
MASRKSFLSKQSYMFQPTRSTSKSCSQGDAMFEFDEADLWNNISVASNNKKGFSSSSSSSSASGLKRGPSRKVVHHDHDVAAATSLPVNIPDWSKILKQEYKDHRKWESDDDDDYEDDDEDDDYNGEGGGVRVPPHEYLAKTRGASLSVHEGIGRTLKGRDLRSVRNAIWKKVGFED